MPPFELMRHDPAEFDLLKSEMVAGSDADWELLDFVRGRFNRCVIFQAPLFHARHPKNGFRGNARGGPHGVGVSLHDSAGAMLAEEQAHG
jgi:hypothetical protein